MLKMKQEKRNLKEFYLLKKIKSEKNEVEISTN